MASVARPKFRYVDLFAGIGGMSIPFRRRGGECVLVCERDAKAVQTYLANHALSCEMVEDANTLNGQVPDHDLLLAGFPCQPFSIAGVSKRNALGRANGFDCADQGNLFFRATEILERKRPRAFLLENVKHLVKHRKGETSASRFKIPVSDAQAYRQFRNAVVDPYAQLVLRQRPQGGRRGRVSTSFRERAAGVS